MPSSPSASRLALREEQILRDPQASILIDITRTVIEHRVRRSLAPRVVAHLMVMAGEMGLQVSTLLAHVESLAASSDYVELKEAAVEVLACLRPYSRLSFSYSCAGCVASTERAALEAQALCTKDVLCPPYVAVQHLTPSALKRAEETVSTACRLFQCRKYGETPLVPGHPALRIGGRQARWYLPPEGQGSDPVALAALFKPAT